MIRRSAERWDGGYAIAGMIGNGDCFVMRDPHGIRPCSYFINDEVIAFASERVPLMTVFDAAREEVHELEPGTVVFVGSDGRMHCDRFAAPVEARPCSFERIYFSRGNDPDIYQDRKRLGAASGAADRGGHRRRFRPAGLFASSPTPRRWPTTD